MGSNRNFTFSQDHINTIQNSLLWQIMSLEGMIENEKRYSWIRHDSIKRWEKEIEECRLVLERLK